MSMFMPEGSGAPPQDGVSSITPANSETTTADIALMQRILAAAARNPGLIPADFMAYVLDWLQVNNLQIPIGQVFGYNRTTAKSAVVHTNEARTSSTFGDLATPGPTLNGLGAGTFLVIWGSDAAGNPGVSNAEMIVQDGNGIGTNNGNVALTSVASATSVVSVDTITLSSGGLLTTKYRSSDNTYSCQWNGRFLIALRF